MGECRFQPPDRTTGIPGRVVAMAAAAGRAVRVWSPRVLVPVACLVVAAAAQSARAGPAPGPGAPVKDPEGGPALGDDAASGTVEVADGDLIEEMTVIGTRIPLSSSERRSIFEELKRARYLYATKQIKEAFPYLLKTARRGFKDSQAKVGDIYLRGMGVVDRDAVEGVGWLGVASSGSTSPTIRNYFNDIWQHIPEQHVPYFEEVVEEYRTRYGEEATGVVCNMHRRLGTHVKALNCFFEQALPDDVRESFDDIQMKREQLSLVAERMRQIAEAMADAQTDRGRDRVDDSAQ